jgi:hypothetical protein
VGAGKMVEGNLLQMRVCRNAVNHISELFDAKGLRLANTLGLSQRVL